MLKIDFCLLVIPLDMFYLCRMHCGELIDWGKFIVSIILGILEYK